MHSGADFDWEKITAADAKADADHAEDWEAISDLAARNADAAKPSSDEDADYVVIQADNNVERLKQAKLQKERADAEKAKKLAALAREEQKKAEHVAAVAREAQRINTAQQGRREAAVRKMHEASISAPTGSLAARLQEIASFNLPIVPVTIPRLYDPKKPARFAMYAAPVKGPHVAQQHHLDQPRARKGKRK